MIKTSTTESRSFSVPIFPVIFPFGELLIGLLNCRLRFLLTETKLPIQVRIVLKQYIEGFQKDFFGSLLDSLFLGISWFSDEKTNYRNTFTLEIDNFVVETQPAMCGIYSKKLGENSRGVVLMVFRRGYMKLLIPRIRDVFEHSIYSLVEDEVFKKDISINAYSDCFVIENQFCFTRDLREIRTTPWESKFDGFPISGIVDCGDKKIMMRRNLELPIYLESAFLPGYSHNSKNYYHFLVEVFPRILYWLKNMESRKVPMICDSESPWQIKELIEKMTGIKPLLVERDQIYNFRELFVCEDFLHEKPVHVFDRESENIFANFEKNLRETRNKIFELSIDQFCGENIERVYIRRGYGHARIPINQENVINVLKDDFNFLIYDFANLSVFRQVEILSCAKVVIAPAGAALTNLMFCNPKTKVIVQPGTPDENLRRFWRDYANLFELDFFELAPPDEEQADKVIYIDEDGLFSCLEQIL